MTGSMTISDLNALRIRLGDRVRLMGMQNVPFDASPDQRLKASADYQFVHDAWMKAETEYGRAMKELSIGDLQKLIGDV